jgi:methionyl-tRNA formyltransferase
MDTRVDIVLSVGCPWLLPMGQLRTKHPSTLYLNVHPSCLPRLRGNHPINGALLFDEPRIGATVHWMEEDFDTGAIVAQVCIDRTPDLDLGLLYAISRLAEADALQRALDALAQVNFAPMAVRSTVSQATTLVALPICSAMQRHVQPKNWCAVYEHSACPPKDAE